MDLMTGLIGALWVAIAAIVVGGLVEAWRRALSGNGPLPFFRALEANGSTPAGAEHLLGTRRLAEAVRRCALCAGRPECERGEAVDCPNADVLRRAGGG